MQGLFSKFLILMVEEFRKIFQAVDLKLVILRNRMQTIIDGQRKTQICDWWLNYIETETDKFLQTHGYEMNCLPDDYLNTAPKDMGAVRENLDLIRSLMKVDFTRSSELDELIQRVTTEVYTVLDELIADTEYVLNLKETDGILSDFIQKHKSSIEKDMEYLLKMKAMDDEIQRRRKCGAVEASGRMEMTDVVPIGGLIMARMHVLECELTTALDVEKHQRRRPRQSLPSNSFDIFSGTISLRSCPVTNEFTEFVMTTCPLYTPKSCVDVMLRFAPQQQSQEGGAPKHGIRLGYFRTQGNEISERSKSE